MAGVKRYFYLSGPLLGELLGQVSPDASSPAGDQHHLPAQVLPPARQQGRQTGSDQVVEHLDREEEHTTRALQLHVGGALAGSSRQTQEKCLRCKFVFFFLLFTRTTRPMSSKTQRPCSSRKFVRMQTTTTRRRNSSSSSCAASQTAARVIHRRRQSEQAGAAAAGGELCDLEEL